MRLLTIENIKLIDKNNNIKYEQSNVKNTLHQLGQFYILRGLFKNKNTLVDFYYAGLDNRVSLSASDTMSSLLNEPSTNGYTRQKINSWNDAVITNSVYVIKSSNITFNASNGVNSRWGPVRNIFLATSQDTSGFLISSVKLSQELTVASGDSIVLVANLSLSN